MLPKSIRSQLPLTYAGIALLATLALGAVLLVTLRGYYSQQEIDYLNGNAEAISQVLSSTYTQGLPPAQLQSQLESLSFLTQSRVQVLTTMQGVIADSGSFQNKQIVALKFENHFIGMDGGDQVNRSYMLSAPAAFSITGDVSPRPTGDWLFNADAPVPSSGTVSGPVMHGSAGSQSDFTVNVAGTPLGFGLNPDMYSSARSAQQVETPLRTSNLIIGYVRLSEGPAYGTEIVQGVARALIGAGFVAVLIAGGVGWIVSQRITAPLNILTDTTMLMAKGDLSARVEINRRDEFGLLSRTFNDMAGRVENTITTLQRFVADAAHELHTPLTAVHANLELALSELNAQRRGQFLEQAQTQLKRLEILTNNLLDLSRIESHTLPDIRTRLDLVSLVRESSELYASRAEQKGIAFIFDVPDEQILAQVCESQLRRVLDNLLDNAIKFTPENGMISLGVCRDGQSVRLWVKDTGIGIPVEDLPLVFSRFRRGRNAAAYPGSGLGLAITQAIIEGHQGKVNVESSATGTHFWVQIPAVS